jgi:hypothetical protein
MFTYQVENTTYIDFINQLVKLKFISEYAHSKLSGYFPLVKQGILDKKQTLNSSNV